MGRVTNNLSGEHLGLLIVSDSLLKNVDNHTSLCEHFVVDN
jgi:hypothetical protein